MDTDELSLARDLEDPVLVRAASAPDDPDVLWKGAIVSDRYHVLNLIGQGGMGAVYRAYDPELDRPIALKLLTIRARPENDTETDDSRRSRVLSEARALAQLSHPNVVSVYDVGKHADTVFIAMELIQGMTLRQWLQDKQPTRKQILEVMHAAGRGLSAAHQAGVIHLDFKPSNIVLGNDGRVRVIDFGLARAAGEPAFETGSIGDTTDTQPGQHARADRPALTAGAAGTPAYMAPEQYLGDPVGNWTDQFSFCVVLYEALCKERPFSKETLQALGENVIRGRIRRSRLDTKVSAWIRHILLRGLSPEPDNRFRDMSELLKALQKNPARRRKRWLLAFGLAASIGFGIYGISLKMQHLQQLCRGSDAKINTVWNTDKKQAVLQAFQATGKPYARHTYGSVEKQLDQYAHAWSHMHTKACRATRVRGEQTEKLLSLRMLCLTRRLNELDALVKIFMQAKDQTLDKALLAAASLSPIKDCADVETLAESDNRLAPPKNEATRKKVSAVRKQLDQIKAMRLTGNLQEGFSASKAALAQAEQIGYLPLEAEARYWLGELHWSLNHYKDAEQAQRDAFLMATASGHDQLAAYAAVYLMYTVGFDLARPDEGILWGQISEAAGKRHRADQVFWARWNDHMSSVLLWKGDYEKSMSLAQRALSLRKQAKVSDYPGLMTSLNNVAVRFRLLGDYDQALEYFQRSHDILVKTFGSEHPMVAFGLANMGKALYAMGEYDRALPLYKQALEIREKTLPANDHYITDNHLLLGALQAAKGEYDQALSHYQFALKRWKQSLGPKHPNVGDTICNLGHLHLIKNEKTKAMKCFREALDIFETSVGMDKPFVATCLANLGDLYFKQHETHRAGQQYQRALSILEKKLGLKHPDLTPALCGIGKVFLAQKNTQKAIEHLDRALSICGEKTCNPKLETEIVFYLAKSIWGKADMQDRATELARRANQGLKRLPAKVVDNELTNMRTWLKTVVPPSP